MILQLKVTIIQMKSLIICSSLRMLYLLPICTIHLSEMVSTESQLHMMIQNMHIFIYISTVPQMTPKIMDFIYVTLNSMIIQKTLIRWKDKNTSQISLSQKALHQKM